MKLILLIFIFTVTFGFVQNSTAQTKSKSNKTKSKPQSKNRVPSRSDIESLFGQAVDCQLPRGTECFDNSDKKIECPKWEGFTCFQKTREISIKVEFNSSEFAKTIQIYSGSQFYQAVEAAKQIIMLNGRGRIIKKEQKDSKFYCTDEFSEEYEYLTMHYSSRNCASLMPGGVTITWKE